MLEPEVLERGRGGGEWLGNTEEAWICHPQQRRNERRSHPKGGWSGLEWRRTVRVVRGGEPGVDVSQGLLPTTKKHGRAQLPATKRETANYKFVRDKFSRLLLQVQAKTQRYYY